MSTYTSYDLARMAGCADPDAWGGSSNLLHVLGLMAEDKSNDWSEEIDALRDEFAKPSPGAVWLRDVEDAARERWDDYVGDGTTDDYAPADVPRLFDHDGVIHEIADDAVPVYTHERWQVFVDLGAWHEDVSDYYAPDRGDEFDMTNVAGIALYLIAERLVRALVQEWADEGDK